MAPTVNPEKTNCSNSAIPPKASQELRKNQQALMNLPVVMSRAGDQRPVAVRDLQHMERGEIEAHVIGRRHVHKAASADKAFGLFDFVTHLRGVGAFSSLHRLDQNHYPVIGVDA